MTAFDGFSIETIRFFEKLKENNTKEGYIVGGKHYKRTPRPYDAAHKQAEFLLHNGLFAMFENDIPHALFSQKIIDHAFLHYKKMYPLHEWLIRAVGK